jgi:DNA-binding response OmpR family regulator
MVDDMGGSRMPENNLALDALDEIVQSLTDVGIADSLSDFGMVRARQGILVVDDALETLKLLVATLTAHGHEVRPANSGRQALEAIHSMPPELIVLDVKMPGIDGFELCRRLKAEEATRDIPVLFLSAETDVQERVKAFEVGCVDCITKPFHEEELVARVQTHLELARLRATLQEMVEARTQHLKTAILRVAEENAEKELARKALRKSERRYRNLVEAAPMGIFQLNLDGFFRYVNKGMLGLHDCPTKEDFLHDYYNVSRCWVQEGGFQDFKASLLLTKEVKKWPVQVALADGRRRDLLCYAFLDPDSLLVNGFLIEALP